MAIQGIGGERQVMHPLEQTIHRLLVGESLLPRDGRVLVGVSGGADSLALLHILAALGSEFSLNLVAAYIDHGLRPGETPAEWACVQEAAHRLGIECDCRMVNVHAAAAARKLSMEHAARELRYQAFAELADTWSTDWLAVAHTADDQVEEVLLRLFRGGGRKALAGMRMRSGNLIRPLLGIPKAELLAYLDDKKIAFCRDSSNDDRRFLRNRIRLDLLPLLEAEYDQGVRGALLKTAANLEEDENLLEDLLARSWDSVVDSLPPDDNGIAVYRLNRTAFQRLHPALQRRTVEKVLWAIGAVARYQHILAVLTAARCGRTGSELHLSQGLRVGVTRAFVEFSYPQGKGPWRGRLSTR
jgi:tRNA(Ile)-lysidine synthase